MLKIDKFEISIQPGYQSDMVYRFYIELISGIDIICYEKLFPIKFFESQLDVIFDEAKSELKKRLNQC